MLCGGEEHFAPRALVSDADALDDLMQATRIRATAEVSILAQRPKCLCQCQPPQVDAAGKDVARAPGQAVDCHKQHNDRVDCAPDGGCGAGCDCGCCVLLAKVEWSDTPKKWRAVHSGERRFLRPAFVADPVKEPK